MVRERAVLRLAGVITCISGICLLAVLLRPPQIVPGRRTRSHPATAPPFPPPHPPPPPSPPPRPMITVLPGSIGHVRPLLTAGTEALLAPLWEAGTPRVPEAVHFVRDPSTPLNPDNRTAGDCYHLAGIERNEAGLCSMDPDPAALREITRSHIVPFWLNGADPGPPHLVLTKHSDPPTLARGRERQRWLREAAHPAALGRWPLTSVESLSAALGRRMMVIAGDSVASQIFAMTVCAGHLSSTLLPFPHTHAPPRITEFQERGKAPFAHAHVTRDGGIIGFMSSPIFWDEPWERAMKHADVIVYNMGLHFGPAKHDEYEAMMRALLVRLVAWARVPGRHAAFVETGTQHFRSTGGDGLYEHRRGSSCAPIREGTTDPRNEIMRRLFDELVPPGTVGYLPFYEMTRELHDRHAGHSVRPDGQTATDCTHFCFMPHLVEALFSPLVDQLAAHTWT